MGLVDVIGSLSIQTWITGHANLVTDGAISGNALRFADTYSRSLLTYSTAFIYLCARLFP